MSPWKGSGVWLPLALADSMTRIEVGVCQGLRRVADEMTSGFGCIFLTPVPTYLLQSSAPCSSLPSARALHSLGEDVEVWDRRATAITGTAWGLGALGGWVGHSCTLRGPLSPALCGDWWTGLPSHNCGLCCPGGRRVRDRSIFPRQTLNIHGLGFSGHLPLFKCSEWLG